ncbi:hypothetical protein [Myxococcus virescens]|uniref:Uncharacterized protein n=1 Tax=Myxococcus virescens TaxID=83456 RepID=A0A511HSC6_9BACT|nr:hypothetical protein [Myxococcus virescens]GEL75389.1 hypothetical protein MVI01_71730 [Myxococcus virescens]SDE65750.1 hypothetical protein SAMN04488504_109303 [Myxococcus virescens]
MTTLQAELADVRAELARTKEQLLRAEARAEGERIGYARAYADAHASAMAQALAALKDALSTTPAPASRRRSVAAPSLYVLGDEHGRMLAGVSANPRARARERKGTLLAHAPADTATAESLGLSSREWRTPTPDAVAYVAAHAVTRTSVRTHTYADEARTDAYAQRSYTPPPSPLFPPPPPSVPSPSTPLYPPSPRGSPDDDGGVRTPDDAHHADGTLPFERPADAGPPAESLRDGVERVFLAARGKPYRWQRRDDDASRELMALAGDGGMAEVLERWGHGVTATYRQRCDSLTDLVRRWNDNATPEERAPRRTSTGPAPASKHDDNPQPW